MSTLAVRGSRSRVVRTRGLSFRVDVRAALVTAALFLVTAAIGVFSLTSGDLDIPVRDVLRSLVGLGDPGTDVIVLELRLPRVLTGILVGGALGVAGALLQTVTRNPLGSPDFIGLTVGSGTGALAVILLGGASSTSGSVALGAIGGCLVTSLVVYLLAFSRHSAGRTTRIILMGIGISAMLEAFNSFLIIRARLADAVEAMHWQIGSLNNRGWEHVWPVALALAVLLPVAVWHGRPLTMLLLGEETATVAGVNVERSRRVLLGCAVGLTALATAAAGPVSFVALAAPQLAFRLTRSAGPGLLPAAAMGGLLLVASDWLAQHALPDNQLPVGVATAALGGGYLVWLLATEWRRSGRAV